MDQAALLAAAGAAQVTVVADREGDVYEDFACKPGAVEVLIRAAHDRLLADGSHLFARAETLPEAGRLTVALAAGPGRRARTAVQALRYCRRSEGRRAGKECVSTGSTRGSAST